MVHSQKKDTFESILSFDGTSFNVAEYSHVRSDSGFEIYYEAEDGDRTYPIFVNMTMLGSTKMAYEVNSEKNHVEEIECANKLSIKNYWQAKIMLAFSCDEETESARAVFIFKLDDLMVMVKHNVNYPTRDWTRELSFEGKELLYEAGWAYEPAAPKQMTAEVELYDDTSSFEEHFYEKTLLFAKQVLIHN